MCVNNSTWHIAYIIVIWKGTPLFKTYMVLDWSLNVLERYFYTTILPYIGRCSQWFAILQWPSLISKPLQPLVKRDTSTHASSVKGYSASYSHGWWIRHMFNSCFGVGMARCGLELEQENMKNHYARKLLLLRLAERVEVTDSGEHKWEAVLAYIGKYPSVTGSSVIKPARHFHCSHPGWTSWFSFLFLPST